MCIAAEVPHSIALYVVKPTASSIPHRSKAAQNLGRRLRNLYNRPGEIESVYLCTSGQVIVISFHSFKCKASYIYFIISQKSLKFRMPSIY